MISKRLRYLYLICFQSYLPKSQKYQYNFTKKDGDDLIEFRLSGATCKESIMEWVHKLEAITNVQYRVWKTYKCKKEDTYRVGV